LGILKKYQGENLPIYDVYDQVTQLFASAPELIEGFHQFLPSSAVAAAGYRRGNQPDLALAYVDTVKANMQNLYISRRMKMYGSQSRFAGRFEVHGGFLEQYRAHQ